MDYRVGVVGWVGVAGVGGEKKCVARNPDLGLFTRLPNLIAHHRKQKKWSRDCDGPVTIRHKGYQFVTDCDGSVTNWDKFQNCDGLSVTIFELSVTKFTLFRAPVRPSQI